MKLLAVLFSLANAAYAQSISIPEPANNATLSAGQSTTIAVADSSTSESSPGVSITLQPVSGALSTVLYNGTYDPQFGPGNLEVPVQEFSVLVPSDFEKGTAQLTVVVTTAADSSVTPESANVTVNIA